MRSIPIAVLCAMLLVVTVAIAVPSWSSSKVSSTCLSSSSSLSERDIGQSIVAQMNDPTYLVQTVAMNSPNDIQIVNDLIIATTDPSNDVNVTGEEQAGANMASEIYSMTILSNGAQGGFGESPAEIVSSVKALRTIADVSGCDRCT